jgi:hypothetical protein
MVLAVGVEDQHLAAGRLSNARFHHSPVSFVVRMPDDASAGLRRPAARVIRGAVIYDEDLVPGAGAAESRDEGLD